MREIKFRAWHKAHEIMCKVISLYQFDRGKVIQLQLYGFNNLIPVAAVELMQFTGLLDKNGREIYEGDIVSASWYSYIEPLDYAYGIVTYFEGYGAYLIANQDCSEHKEITSGGCYHFEIEVIGNIYENPELLKG